MQIGGHCKQHVVLRKHVPWSSDMMTCGVLPSGCIKPSGVRGGCHVYPILLLVSVIFIVVDTSSISPQVCGDVLMASSGYIHTWSSSEHGRWEECQSDKCSSCDYYLTAPVKDQIIVLNFTNRLDNSSRKCRPVVVQDIDSGMADICKVTGKRMASKVIHGHTDLRPNLQLTYTWQRHCNSEYNKLAYTFCVCAAHCDDGSCLKSSVLLCNGNKDCPDGSDESGTKCALSTTTSHPLKASSSQPLHNSAKDWTVIIVIVGVVFCMILALFVCVGMACSRLQCCSLRGQRRQHNLLQPHPESSQRPGVNIYLPGPGSDERTRRDTQRQTERSLINARISLPPNIPISKDGEEGYKPCLELLTTSLINEENRESVRPPPNRTIFDGESPPPYRSHSVGRLDRPNGRVATRIIRDSNGSPRVERCYSMSNNNNPRNSNLNTAHQQQPRRTRHSAGHSPNGSTYNNLGAPPCYNEVIADDNVYRGTAPTQL